MAEEALLEKPIQIEAPCAHHWIIEPASGPTSKGVCRRCGAEKEFRNYIEGGSWDDDRALVKNASRGRSAPSSAMLNMDPEDES